MVGLKQVWDDEKEEFFIDLNSRDGGIKTGLENKQTLLDKLFKFQRWWD